MALLVPAALILPAVPVRQPAGVTNGHLEAAVLLIPLVRAVNDPLFQVDGLQRKQRTVPLAQRVIVGERLHRPQYQNRRLLSAFAGVRNSTAPSAALWWSVTLTLCQMVASPFVSVPVKA